MRQFQDAMFEVNDLPMADAFEAAERSDTAQDSLEAQQQPQAVNPPQSLPKPLDAKAQALEAYASLYYVHCLRCGKNTGDKMFCSAKCRTSWSSSMSAWSNKLTRTTIQGEQALEFGE